MAKKCNQESKIEELKDMSGYVIYNADYKRYYDEDYEVCDIERVEIYDSLEEARDCIEDLDDPRHHEIHKINFIYNIEEIYKRKINYELVDGKIEKETI